MKPIVVLGAGDEAWCPMTLSACLLTPEEAEQFGQQLIDAASAARQVEDILESFSLNGVSWVELHVRPDNQ